MARTIHGRIHGKTIELDEDLGIADGEQVEVIVKPVAVQRPCGEGFRLSAGAFADSWTKEDDRCLEEIQKDRKRKTERDIPE